jgi:iron complex outermembrane receptor protein
VRTYTTVDTRLSYNFQDRLAWSALHNLRVGLDVTNLFDSEPPFVNIAPGNNGGGGFDPNAANPIGRLVSFSIGKRF